MATAIVVPDLEVVKTKVRAVLKKSCCPSCGKAAEIVIDMAKQSQALQEHLSSVLKDAKLTFVPGETPSYDDKTHTITYPHNNDPGDIADGLVFESFNAIHRADFTAMKQYSDDVAAWGSKRAEIEGKTIKGYTEAAQTLDPKARTSNMSKAVEKLELWKDKFVPNSLATPHDPKAPQTDMRSLCTNQLYIYQQIENLTLDNVPLCFAKVLAVKIPGDLKFTQATKLYSKDAQCPADAKFNECVILFNWLRNVWPTNLKGGKPTHRPLALFLILDEVQANQAVFPTIAPSLTRAAFGLDDHMLQLASAKAKDLKPIKYQ